LRAAEQPDWASPQKPRFLSAEKNPAVPHAQSAKTALFAGGKAPSLRANFFAPMN
jgi:hypothetical protein